LLAAYTAGDTRLESSCTPPYAGVETSVRAVASFYAPTDLAWAYDNPANEFVINGPATLRRFLGGSPHETPALAARFRLASPVSHVSARTPPTLLIHGGRDQLVREENMHRLAARLTDANVAHDTVFLSYAQHGFDYNFNGWGAQVVQPVLLEFLNKHLAAQ
jgi:acetyl esterase/lipase